VFNHVHVYVSWSFVFTCMVFKIIIFFLQTEALPPANGKSFLWIFQKARRRRHFWAFGLSLKEHCFHQVESNLKTRHYEYAFDFEGYSIYSFVLMFSFFIFIYYLFSKRQYVFISWKTMIINTNLYFFVFFTSFYHFYMFIFKKILLSSKYLLLLFFSYIIICLFFVMFPYSAEIP